MTLGDSVIEKLARNELFLATANRPVKQLRSLVLRALATDSVTIPASVSLTYLNRNQMRVYAKNTGGQTNGNSDGARRSCHDEESTQSLSVQSFCREGRSPVLHRYGTNASIQLRHLWRAPDLSRVLHTLATVTASDATRLGRCGAHMPMR